MLHENIALIQNGTVAEKGHSYLTISIFPFPNNHFQNDDFQTAIASPFPK